MRGFFEGFMIGQDPNNLLIQARKALTADPAQGGDMAEALGRITAKTTIVCLHRRRDVPAAGLRS